jgi:hypothetical protein
MDSTTSPWAIAPCSAATTVPSLRRRADVLRSRTGLGTSKLPACTRQESGDKCMALHRIARMLRHGDPSPCRLQTVLDVGYDTAVSERRSWPASVAADRARC